MKMLYMPQLSVDVDGKWNLEADSNWRVAEDLFTGLFAKDQKLQIDLILPMEEKLLDPTAVDRLAARGKVTAVHTHLPNHPFENRFHFNSTFWRTLVKEGYDVVWLNDPCLVMNVRAVYEACGVKQPLIVSYNHWIDNHFSKKTPESMSYYFRQVEGALYSDLHFTNTEFSKEFFLKGARPIAIGEDYKAIADKTYAIPPPVDMNELERYRASTRDDSVIRFAYTQRLSKLPYYRKSLDRFIAAMDRLAMESPLPVEAWLFNPAQKQLDESLTSRPYVKVVTPRNKREYLTALSQCHVTADFYEDERVWSISQNEACALDVMPILRWFDGYREMYPDDYLGYYTNEQHAYENMLRAVVDSKWRHAEVMKAKSYMISRFSSESIGERVLSLIKEAVR
jgi:glycosyltransferase involved in cell wall biosynthesis